jgi:cleavage and polyadenylation specificity factor subunit 4|tara:strand:+ start:1082 stop:2350 length:1269 start_codon:yes stop_codon:yes gene_type:complete
MSTNRTPPPPPPPPPPIDGRRDAALNYDAARAPIAGAPPAHATYVYVGGVASGVGAYANVYVPPGAPLGYVPPGAMAPATASGAAVTTARGAGPTTTTTTTTTRGTKRKGADGDRHASVAKAKAKAKAKREMKSASIADANAAATMAEVKVVDPSSLPEDVRRYREERAKYWPSDRNVRAKTEAGEEEERARAARRERLREILAKQREMGHFEASQEIGEEEGGVAAPAALDGKGVEARAADGSKVCRFWLQGGCRKGSACDFKHESAPNKDQKCRFFARGRCKAGARCPFKHEVTERKSSAADGGGNPQTLLKKLLDKEIKRDEQRLLQLFRFFVNNDFFTGTKGVDEPLWMFPWADSGKKVIDRRAALASLSPVDDEDDEDEVAPPPVAPADSVEEKRHQDRPDMGFFAAYDSDNDSNSD